jgi:hypothetical protein
MWKLFAMVLVISDTGSVSTSQIATDFASLQACQAAITELFPPAVDRDIAGHHLAIRARTECRSDGGPPLPPSLPPFGGFFGR